MRYDLQKTYLNTQTHTQILYRNQLTLFQVEDDESSSVTQQSDSSEFLPEDLGNADCGSTEQQCWETCDFTGGDF